MAKEMNINPNSLSPFSFSSAISNEKRSQRPIPLFFNSSKRLEDGCMSPPPVSPTPHELKKNIPFIDDVTPIENDKTWFLKRVI